MLRLIYIHEKWQVPSLHVIALSKCSKTSPPSRHSSAQKLKQRVKKVGRNAKVSEIIPPTWSVSVVCCVKFTFSGGSLASFPGRFSYGLGQSQWFTQVWIANTIIVVACYYAQFAYKHSMTFFVRHRFDSCSLLSIELSAYLLTVLCSFVLRSCSSDLV